MVMKHIKLFENWAEELEVPEYLDPNWIPPKTSVNIFSTKVQDNVRSKRLNLTSYKSVLDNSTDKNVQFVSFSDYDFWEEEYEYIHVTHDRCKYRLKDCIGIPLTSELIISITDVKSLKGLEDNKIIELEVRTSKLENLKYCPSTVKTAGFSNNPLSSYYMCPTADIKYFDESLCGLKYKEAGYTSLTSSVLDDAKFHANVFSSCPNSAIKHPWLTTIKYPNQWKQIHDDPNDVENFSFLFLPFYDASENFRDKAQQYIKNLDMSKFERRSDKQLW